jgi:hypothetical protein
MAMADAIDRNPGPPKPIVHTTPVVHATPQHTQWPKGVSTDVSPRVWKGQEARSLNHKSKLSNKFKHFNFY